MWTHLVLYAIVYYIVLCQCWDTGMVRNWIHTAENRDFCAKNAKHSPMVSLSVKRHRRTVSITWFSLLSKSKWFDIIVMEHVEMLLSS